jgi:adenylosuccinate lyase
VEEYVCAELGLRPAEAASQIVQRDVHAEFVWAMAATAATLEKMAVEIRHLARTEVREVQEPFRRGQKGSSAMPHKRNPVVSERITGLARLLRGNLHAALENVALWHERDISHSSVERVILPDSSIALDYMLHLAAGLIEGLIVDPGRMRSNLDATQGLIYSQRVLLALIERGMSRDQAYDVVQQAAAAVWEGGGSFGQEVSTRAGGRLSEDQLRDLLDPAWFVRNLEGVFVRLEKLEVQAPPKEGEA